MLGNTGSQCTWRLVEVVDGVESRLREAGLLAAVEPNLNPGKQAKPNQMTSVTFDVRSNPD